VQRAPRMSCLCVLALPFGGFWEGGGWKWWRDVMRNERWGISDDKKNSGEGLLRGGF
jgi:hypothetical protein